VDFFGIGFGEILLVLVVALVIWGPGRIVEISLKLGKIARNLRRVTSNLATQLTRELDLENNESPDSAAKKTHHPEQADSPEKGK
jgi:sec-independent protein translocase protein TatA